MLGENAGHMTSKIWGTARCHELLEYRWSDLVLKGRKEKGLTSQATMVDACQLKVGS